MTTTFTHPHRSLPQQLSVRIPAWITSVEEIATGAGLDSSRMKILLHQLFLCYLKNSRLRRSKVGKNYIPDYFPVSSNLLKQTCTDNYRKYISALIQAGVIDRRKSEYGTSSYVVGVHAQLYRWRIGDSSHGGCSFRKETVTGYKQIKSVMRTRDQFIKECRQNAIEYSIHNPVFVQLQSYLDDILFDAEYYKISEQHCVTSDLRFLESEALANKDFAWFSVDKFGNRLHHPFTTMPKEYRKHLRFQDCSDKPLIELDIKNSQPYFSSVLSSKRLINEYLIEFLPLLPYIEKFERKADFLLYRKLCVEGRLYEFLMESLSMNSKNENDRHKIKELFFASVLFSKLRVYGEKSRFREAFKSVFPSVHAMFQTIKGLDETVLPELKNIIRPTGKKFKYEKSNDAYKLVACLMQRSEATVMLQIVAPRLVEEGIKFITIHDSVMLLPEHAERAKQIIGEAFKSIALPPPTLS
ncbi:MAG: hypothetical protein U0T74_14935 [Chitinophagales bacterium]